MELRKLIREVLAETSGQSVETRAAAVRERISEADAEEVLMAGLRELVRQELSAVRSRANTGAPARSSKVAGYRRLGEEWKRLLEVEYTVEGGARKPLAQLTRDDILFNIATREKAAAATLRQAARLRDLHELLVEHDADVVADLPEDVQRTFLATEDAA